MQERIIPEPSPGTMPEPNPHRLTPASPAFIGCDNPSINNGSISRDSVPLWKERDDIGTFVRPIDRVRTITLLHNGSISRDSVPLWKERDKRQVKLLSGEPMSGKMM